MTSGLSNPNPLVSVIMPAYNAEAFIREAIESVLAQTFTDYELIVIDNVSKDRTAEIARSYGDRVQLMTDSRRGPNTCRNAAMKIAKGRYFAFIDADDIWLPRKLEKQVEMAAAHPDFGIISTDALWFQDDRVTLTSLKKLYRIVEGHAVDNLLSNNWISTSAAMVRREALEHTKGFDEEPGIFGADWMLWIQIAAKYPIYFVDEVLLRRRMHITSYANSKAEDQFENLFRNLSKLRAAVPELDPSLINRVAFKICWNRAWGDFTGLQLERARHKLSRGMSYKPFAPAAWALYLATYLPESILAGMKSVYKKAMGASAS